MLENKTIIAGPCSAESREQVLKTAEGLTSVGISYFRAGLWKPRTRPGCFEGVGEKGLEWMREVKQKYGLKIATEVAFREHVEMCLSAGVDLVWIGARTTSNPFLVQELAEALGGKNIKVLVKNPINPDVDLWAGAVDRLTRAGVRNVGVIHRGFSSYQKIKYRNAPGWQIAIEFRQRYPDVPFFCDPSHLAGRKDYILELSQKSLDLGLDGLMIETHCSPSQALSDSGQQLTPSELKCLLDSLSARKPLPTSEDVRSRLEEMRRDMDVIDTRILQDLTDRMDISRQMGHLKKAEGISVIQTGRWNSLLERVCEESKKYGLREDYVKSIFSIIHDASIDEQD